MLTSGDVLGNRYRLEEPIAAGGMGDVWRATDTVLDRTVAAKVLRSNLHDDPSFVARFRAEARILATFRHPGVVEIYDFGDAVESGHQVAYLIMPYVHAEPLTQRIASAGRLPAAETMTIISQVALALEAAHSYGIIHRDVKPDNLLINGDGGVVLVDFGVAQDLGAGRVTDAGQIIGSVRYMAPEQVMSDLLSAATDVYALGVVAYHCLAGHPPFNGSTPIGIAMSQLRDTPPPLPDDVPRAVSDVVMTAMAKEPAGRYPSAAAMARAAIAANAATSTGTAAFSTPPAPGNLTSTREFAVGQVAVPPARPAAAFQPDHTSGYTSAYGEPPTGTTARAGKPRGPLVAGIAACVAGIAVIAIAFALSGSPAANDQPGTGARTSSSHTSGHAKPKHGEPNDKHSTGTSGKAGQPQPGASPTATRAPSPSSHPTTSPAPPATTSPATSASGGSDDTRPGDPSSGDTGSPDDDAATGTG